MSSTLKAKDINPIIKLLIHGYVRTLLLLKNDTTINIPLMIYFMICTFYWINDKFLFPLLHKNDIEVINGKLIKVISDNITTKTPITICRWAMIKCLRNVIQIDDTSVRKYIWTIKYSCDTECRSICFGIVADHHYCSNNNHSEMWDYDEYYAVSSQGFFFNSSKSQIVWCKDPSFQNPNNMIHLCLDVESRNLTVRFDHSYIMYVVGANIQFRGNHFLFIVSIPMLKKTQIEMIDFRTEHYH